MAELAIVVSSKSHQSEKNPSAVSRPRARWGPNVNISSYHYKFQPRTAALGTPYGPPIQALPSPNYSLPRCLQPGKAAAA